MKKIIIITTALLLAFIAIAVTRCKKMEEVYACDPVINEWVKSNLRTIQQMNRQYLLQLELEKQSPAYKAFTPEQKYNCWVDKLEQVKSLEWTEKEFTHICLLAETMKLEWFEDNFRKTNFDRIDNFLKKWVDDGYSYFGWTKDEVGRMVACLKEVAMEDGNVVLKEAGGGSGEAGGKKPACTCSLESDWCNGGDKCKNIPCQGHPYCGTLWFYYCDGRCDDSPINT
jgi:uncharacterized protein YxeA